MLPWWAMWHVREDRGMRMHSTSTQLVAFANRETTDWFWFINWEKATWFWEWKTGFVSFQLTPFDFFIYAPHTSFRVVQIVPNSASVTHLEWENHIRIDDVRDMLDVESVEEAARRDSSSSSWSHFGSFIAIVNIGRGKLLEKCIDIHQRLRIHFPAGLCGCIGVGWLKKC